MTHISENIKAFFAAFNEANNAFDPDLLAPLMSDPLVGADPNGGVATLKKEEFLAGAPERKAYLEALGFRFVNVEPVEEVSLSDHYTLVKTHGKMRLEKPSGESIDLIHNASYVLFIKEGTIRIVFSLSHEDPMKMAQDQGFFPTNPEDLADS